MKARGGRPWFVHVHPVRRTWVVVRGMRGPMLSRFGVHATYSPKHRGVLVLTRRLGDVEVACRVVGARYVLHRPQLDLFGEAA